MSATVLLAVVAVVGLLLAGALAAALLRLGELRRDALDAQRQRGDTTARLEVAERRLSDLQSLLTQQLNGTQQILTERLGAQESALRELLGQQTASLQGQTGMIQKHMQGTQTTLAQVTEKMGAVAQTSARMAELGRDIEELQRLLKAPKSRGQMGELGLETLLNDMLPRDRVLLQHTFADGRKVDAAVRLDKGLLPVDAKFPMEDFHRLVSASDEERPKARRALLSNLKKKIDDIAKLYIRPAEGTLPLALMYLPSEAVYYEAFVARERDEEDLWDYAYRRSVLPLSPGTLAAYLKSVALGLRAVAVEQNAREVMGLLGALERDLASYRKPFDILGTHLANAHKQYEESLKALGRLEDRLEKARDLGVPEGDPGTAG